MSFGVSNLGVINQRQAPAIWESDFADFPPNFIAGRILIALDAGNAGIYIDGVGQRFQIANGKINFLNGLATVGLQTPTTQTIGLGGELTQNTTIDTNAATLSFTGNVGSTIVKQDGYLAYDSFDQNVPAVTTSGLTTTTPNATLFFVVPNDAVYKVLAEIV